MGTSFLRAYPKMYSFYLNVRNNFSFIMKLSNKYNPMDHKVINKTVSTRQDVIHH